MQARLFDAGHEFDIAAYGLDAMDILRIEKGHLTGAEIDGLRTLDDLGLARMARADKAFVGGAMMQREGMCDSSRIKFVGLVAESGQELLAAGSHLVRNARLQEPAESLGHISSGCFSPQLDSNIALGFIRGGAEMIGETVYASNPIAGTHVAAKIVSPHFFDAKGERLRV
jgi:sarcosine oxidase subunit alpha